ncbi:TPA: hypothetical protein ACH1K3_003119 [Proteus mirabilis]
MTIELSGDNRSNFKTKFDKYTQTEKTRGFYHGFLLKTDIAVKN